MKISPKTFCCLLIFAFISQIAGSESCKWKDPISSQDYDFSGLDRSEGWKVKDIATANLGNLFNIDFLFNFCSPLKGVCNGKNNLGSYEALEVLGQITDACESLGSMDQREVTVGTSLGQPGLKIIYRGGDICVGSENPVQNGQPMQSSFNIICSARKDKEFQQVAFNGQNITKCSPEFFIYHPAGCVGGVYHSSRGIISWLTILFVIYAVIGSVYNMKVQNKKGLEVFPHIDFWRRAISNFKNLPNWMKENGEKIIANIRKEANSEQSGTPMTNQGLTSGSKSAQYTLV